MAALLRLIDSFNKWLTILLGIVLAVMSIVIISQVLSRYIFGIPLPWSEELARYLMSYSVFVGAALALRKQQLIAVEFISERLSWKPRRALKVAINVISIILFAILFMKGIEMMGKVGTQLSAGMQIPMSIPYASIPIGAILLTMNAVAVIIELVLAKEAVKEGEAA
ncbi:TRAP transporter small permease [Ammoniphilus resinae]|uniref:TRAP-type C4-dicarboxylate transport system permease small subunit n=1 Tax=Ammoniphilus resinae TaxID=861532 RepID=A0ABS4GRH4_9BACL|nr:TRAP transporter small permease [Ammoniphilus resinae]MBP1932470.1 TRAP-type C4-dicarboxylate transport system permease small subunit [Ammoniphilus resinae]